MRTFVPTRLRSTPTVVVATLVAATLMVSGAVALGIRVPRSWLGHGPSDGSSLDYRALNHRLEPLRDGYVQSVRGEDAVGSAPHGEAADDRSDRRVAVTHAYTNDRFVNAYTVSSLPFSAHTDATGATRDAGEPPGCLPAGGTTWYRYTSPTDQALFADSFGTDRVSALAAYEGSGLDHLSSLGCDANALGNAQVGFTASPGHTYWFQIAGVTPGTTVFELTRVGPTTVESLTPDGLPQDGPATAHPTISGDGRYVAFNSYARNLVPGAPPCGGGEPGRDFCVTLYLRDLATHRTLRIAAQGTAYAPSDHADLLTPPSISTDGRYVAFSAYHSFDAKYSDYRDAPREAPKIAESSYIYDRMTGKIALVSRNGKGEPAGNGTASPSNIVIGSGSWWTAISGSGRFVVFASDSDNMRTNGEPDVQEVYRRDLLTGEVRLASTDAEGRPLKTSSCMYSGRNVSDDGRFVLFMNADGSGAIQPPGGGGNGALWLIYLWDATTGRTTIVSKLPPGMATKGNYCPALSNDGSHAAFVSRDALVPDDTNGTPDVYDYDVAARKLTRISVTSDGHQTVDPNYAGEDNTPVVARNVTLSRDGRYAVFDSAAPNLVPGTVGGTKGLNGGVRRVYLHDLRTGATSLVSVSSTGEALSGDCTMPYISSDGSTVTFFQSDVAGGVNVVVHRLR